jgi:hypothetical protein
VEHPVSNSESLEVSVSKLGYVARFLDAFVIFALVSGPFSSWVVDLVGSWPDLLLGFVWGIALGLMVGLQGDISKAAGTVLGMALGSGIYWGPVDGMIVGFVVAIPSAMSFGLVTILLDWSMGAGVFWGLVIGISAVLFVLLGGGMLTFVAAVLGCVVGNVIRIWLRLKIAPDSAETEAQ